jgi:quinol monooxygenase YgiN
MHIAIGGTFTVHPDDKAAFLKIIEAVTKPSRAEPGCLRYWFSQSLEDANKIHLFEVWKDRDALEVHFKTPHLLKFREDIGKLRLERDIKRYTAEELTT